MSRVKKISILLFRLVLAFAAMVIAYILGSMIIGETNLVLTAEEEAQAGQALLFVSLSSALVLSFPILHSPRYGLKLIGAVFLVHFGVETFMSQIETLYFRSAVQMETDVFVSIVAAGALRDISGS